MTYRLILVGHHETIKEMKSTIEAKFKQVQVSLITFDKNDHMAQVKNQLLKLMPISDGILYSRKDPYLMMSNQLVHTIPARYVHIQHTDFIKSLFEASIQYNIKPLTISVDGLDYRSIMEAYASVGFDSLSVNPMIVDIPLLSENYTDKVTKNHIRHYGPRMASLCVTNIRSVYEHLLTRNISCVLMTPSSDNYLSEVNSLLLESSQVKSSHLNTVVFAIHINIDASQYGHSKSLFAETMVFSKVNQLLSFYAEQLDGLYIQESPRDFLIICSEEKAQLMTDHFKSIEIMETISHETECHISLGIGLGKSYSELMQNAKLGLHLSLNQGTDCAHIVYSKREITGPLHPKTSTHGQRDTHSLKTQIMSDKTELSTNTISKLQAFSESTGDKDFTSNELADYMAISLRSSNRMINKLIDSGYVMITGKIVTGDKGRPTRMMRFI